ncbi:uncharacterized protein GLRG_05369 [Colletotrichum graminicola M1.001]|uniref:Uncharacterized protein n=1 Tax=Colletotrichum graminicola (strain M1.001 / M2 / FGSC 10212) TaxID=645133 RepID=E3QH63_COLGM|nr:uncharacterized protein GLRG_05369 [Colletotrichum graminicola M1.001]EFQ30225.1 hypothetical protein GLRG_05369 [Colletotrichum graminicola M1.001]
MSATGYKQESRSGGGGGGGGVGDMSMSGRYLPVRESLKGQTNGRICRKRAYRPKGCILVTVPATLRVTRLLSQRPPAGGSLIRSGQVI